MTCNKGKQVYTKDSRVLAVVTCLSILPYLPFCVDIRAAGTINSSTSSGLDTTVNLLSRDNVSYKPILETPARPATTNVAAKSSKSSPSNLSGTKTTPKALRQLRAYSKDEVIELIKIHAARHGLDPEIPLEIARCESGYRWDVRNKTSTATGVFQYLRGTWARTSEGRKGTSVQDADANIRMAVSHIAIRGTSPWNESKHCWDA